MDWQEKAAVALGACVVAGIGYVTALQVEKDIEEANHPETAIGYTQDNSDFVPVHCSYEDVQSAVIGTYPDSLEQVSYVSSQIMEETGPEAEKRDFTSAYDWEVPPEVADEILEARIASNY